MKHWCGLVIFMLLFSIYSQGQTIQVVEKTSLTPIANVAVYSDDQSTFSYTDQDGRTNIESFPANAILIFQHPAYQQRAIRKADLLKAKSTVLMTEKIIKINEVVISANKWEQDKNDIPNKIHSITPKEITTQNPQTTADMLANTGKIFVQKSQLGGGSPMLRGFAANSVLLVVDGVRMNNAIYRSGNLQNVINLDAQSLEGAEVIFGPGSVIYGSDALGGVMDFHTKTPSLQQDSDWLSGNALVRYSSANNEQTAHLDLSVMGDKISSLSSFTVSRFGDLLSGSNRPAAFPDFGKRFRYVKRIGDTDSIISNSNVDLQVPSGYDQMNLMQKIRFRPFNELDLIYAFHYSTTSDIPRYDRLLEDDGGVPVYASWYYGPQKWSMHHLKSTIYGSNFLFDEAKLGLAYQDIEESRNRRRLYQSQRRTQIEEVDVFSINLDLNKSLSEKHQLFYGAEWVHNKVSSSAFHQHILSGDRSEASTRYPDGGSDYTSMAGYVSHQWDLSKEIVLNSGARYTLTRLNALTNQQLGDDLPFSSINMDNGALNGSLGLVFKPNATWKTDLLASTGFRAPNVDDVGKVFEFTDNFMVIPNPDLKPEFVYNIEAGIEKNFGFLRAWITGYYTWLRDAIVRRNVSFMGQDSLFFDEGYKKLQANKNAGKAYIAGLSLNLEAEFTENLFATSNLTFTDGQDVSEDLPLRHVAPLFGRTSIIFKYHRFEGEIFAIYNGAKPRNQLAPSELAKPHLYSTSGSLAWHTINLRAAYFINSKISMRASAENIFDKHYRPYSSGISAPGRNFMISMSANF